MAWIQAEYLQLRPPQTSDSRVKKWTHQPEVLIRRGCTYPAVVGSNHAYDIVTTFSFQG